MSSMSDRVFIDTNVLVYCFDRGEPEKRARALEVVNRFSDSSGEQLVLSTQVMQELYVTLTRKLNPSLSELDAERAVAKLAELPIVPIDRAMVLSAIGTSRRYQLSLWDSLILQAAFTSGCCRVLSEDMQDGFELEGVIVENPFRDIS
jgi:predicted nucleic acid-binding protein